MSKPLQGSKFRQFSDDIMGIEPEDENVQNPKSVTHADQENN